MAFLSELKRRNVLRVVAAYVVGAWLVIQVVETIFPAFGFGDAAVRIVVLVLAVGLLPVVIAAWVLELTPEGLRRDMAVDDDRSVPLRTGRKLDKVIMIALAIGLGYFALDKFVFSKGPQPESTTATVTANREQSLREPSLAVLPFANMSSDEEQEYLSDGIAEELLNLLAKVPEVRVISRSSAFTFKDRNVKISDLARELNVNYVLEGSVRRSGNRVRITAQLIDAISDKHLWSETYERNLDDIFAIQDDIARSVLPALEVQLLGEAPTTTETDPEAYALYLQALHFYLQRSSAGVERAIDHALRAIDIDSAYAPSWTLLASAYINQAHAGQRPFEEGFELAGTAIDEALRIDPDYPLAHSARAWIAMAYEKDYAASAKHFRHARTLAPNNSVILANNAVLATKLGRLIDARRMTEQSMKLDPTSSVAYGNFAELLMRLGKTAEAEQAARKSLELSPGNNNARTHLALTLILQNQPSRAVEVASPIENDAAKLLILSMAHHDLGELELSDQALQTLKQNHATDRAFLAAIGHAWRGDVDESFEWLNRALDEGQAFFGIKTEVYLNALHDDSRWEEVLVKAGLSDRQVANIDL